MRKILSFMVFTIFCVGVYAQSIFSEDFESVTLTNGFGGVPTGWAQYNQDGLTPVSNYSFMGTDAWKTALLNGGNKAGISVSYYTIGATGTSNDWLVSPQISVPSTGNYFLLFDATCATSSYPDGFSVYVSTTGNTPSDFTSPPLLSLTDAGDAGFSQYSVNLSAFSGQNIYFAVVNDSTYGEYLLVDNFSVESVGSNDISLESIELNNFSEINTPNTLKAVVKNIGSNTINNVTLNWNDGNDHSEVITVNIPPFSTQEITHTSTIQYSSPGTYSITVSVDAVNGGVDSDTSNNTISTQMSIATNSTVRLPLFEKFTSSTCGPCASFNNNAFNPFFNANSANFALINYQVNWPSSGDPYYNASITGPRVSYYGISAAPTTVVDGTVYHDSYSYTQGQVTNLLTNAQANPSFFVLSSEHTIDETNEQVNVVVNITPYVTGTIKLHAAILEGTTTGNVATNGETSFKDVLMTMSPDASGEEISVTADTPITFNFTADMSNTFVEEYSDLKVVVFVQDDSSKEILQSAKSTQNDLGVNDLDANNLDLVIYPNPTSDVITIKGEKLNGVNSIEIFNISGQLIKSIPSINLDIETTLNISDLTEGVYIIKVYNENQSFIKKLIKN